MSAANTKMEMEKARILWRARVLAEGGAAWLAEQARRLKHREADVGPHRLTWPS